MKDNVLFSVAILLLLVALVVVISTAQIILPGPPTEVAFKSYHGRYVTAKGEDDSWALRQDTELSERGRFILYHLVNGKVALKTWYGRYVTAPESCSTRQECMIGQESRLGKCGQFDLYDLGENRRALKTCAGDFLTAGNDTWGPELEWSVVGETKIMKDWEVFTVTLQPY